MIEVSNTVVMGYYIPELQERCVYLDDDLGGRLATEYLIQQGHTSIAHILYPTSVTSSTRTIGYRQALDRAKLAHDPDLLVMSDGFDETSGFRATKRLLHRGRQFSAIFTASDQLAIGVMAALRDHGLSVPGDVSVVGYNNSPFTQFTCPPLTTIHQPIFEMAQAACFLAIALLRGEKGKEVKRKFEPTLVERSSVSRPRIP
jgi:LacI family transcriptional regulator